MGRIKRKYALRFHGINKENENGFSRIDVDIGRFTEEKWMMMKILHMAASTQFFEQLRTQQQLGYRVGAELTVDTQGSANPNAITWTFAVESYLLEPAAVIDRMEDFMYGWLMPYLHPT